MPTTDPGDGQGNGGATQIRTTQWADEMTMTPHLRRFSTMDSGSDFQNTEENAAACHIGRCSNFEVRTEYSWNYDVPSWTEGQDRQKAQLTAEELCWDSKAALEFAVMTSDASNGLKSFLHELRKTAVGLRFFNEKTEPFVDIKDLH